MKRNSRRFILTVSLSLFTFLLFSSIVFAGEKEKYFEIGLGGGINLESINTKQILLAPAINWKVKGYEPLRFRLEGDLELIDDHGRVSVIGGVAPFLRIHASDKDWRPFLEVGAGVNLSSRDEIGGRNLGGAFLFSLMGGAGVEFVTRGGLISISYRFRHLSNAHLYRSNQGINFQYVMVSVGF